MDKREALQTIAAEAAQGKLTFPSHVKVALRVLRLLDDPDCHIESVLRLVKAEPVLSARVVAVANSPALNTSGKTITDARTAMARMGLRTVRTLAVAEVARQLANMAPHPDDRVLSTRLWTHSVHVAALAHLLAKRVTRQDPETALFAGIVHELGGLYLLFRAKDFPCLLETRARVQTDGVEHDDRKNEGPNEEEGEGALGRTIMHALSIPEPVLRVIEDLWKGHLTVPPTSLGDTLLLADELAPVRSPLRQCLNAPRSSNGRGIDMMIDGEMLSAILEESAANVESLTQALKG